MIDFDGITDTIVIVAAKAVGQQLSTIGTNQSPSIVREYGSSDKPPYPFLTYDVRHVTSQSHRPFHEGFNEDGHWIVTYQERLAIKFCAKGDRSKEIISTLYGEIKLPSTTDLIRHRLPTFNIQNLMPIKSSPMVAGTQYVEEHSFIINATILNSVHDKFVTCIDSAEVTGELYTNDDLTLTFTTTVPTTT